MIFDFRFRPPYEDFLNLSIFNPPCCSTPPLSFHAIDTPSANLGDMSLFFEEMDEAGISGGAVIPRMLPGKPSVSNECVRRLVEVFPDRHLVPFGAIDVSSGIYKALEELELCIQWGFRGIAMEPGGFTPALKVDDARLYPVYARCEQKNILVMLTLSLWQGPDMEYSSPVAVQHIARDFPHVQFIIAHAGYPWAVQAIKTVSTHGNVWLIPDMYLHNPMTPGREAYVQGIKWLDGERILFGSAYPCYDMRQAVKDFMNLNLTNGQNEKILYKNALRILNLK